ncbi:hypothetical protein FORMB_19180 [Formosa sp. Hel1_33_131]|uniref:hypothetical protein n=1 Tax=Formosa sp. Hel1_33_131 TaxID=1336794 RepID=UPI0008649589|nr:hypothetical protein [Formosa sp. Hel1_33_131]AOR28948.1 hypothetical protein FORMB_19180 [Formosa sp. Hel1_33_131]
MNHLFIFIVLQIIWIAMLVFYAIQFINHFKRNEKKWLVIWGVPGIAIGVFTCYNAYCLYQEILQLWS